MPLPLPARSTAQHATTLPTLPVSHFMAGAGEPLPTGPWHFTPMPRFASVAEMPSLELLFAAEGKS